MGFMSASLYYEANCTLGEGISYDHRSDSVIWVDIKDQTLYILGSDRKSITKHRMPAMVSFVCLSTHGRYIVGLQTGLYSYDPKSGHLKAIYPPKEHPNQGLHWNVGKCSPHGDIWAGTMRIEASISDQGTLYRLKRSGDVTQVISNDGVFHSICWHEDLHRVYMIVKSTRQILVYTYKEDTPTDIRLERVIDLPPALGYPAGVTIDEDGMLWIAHWDGGCVARWHPETGQLINKIEVPVPLITSCTFGGPDKSRLFVSTARSGLSDSQLKKYPLSGSIFVIDTITHGLEATVYQPADHL